jgi:hypothetical protein
MQKGKGVQEVVGRGGVYLPSSTYTDHGGGACTLSRATVGGAYQCECYRLAPTTAATQRMVQPTVGRCVRVQSLEFRFTGVPATCTASCSTYTEYTSLVRAGPPLDQTTPAVPRRHARLREIKPENVIPPSLRVVTSKQAPLGHEKT